MENPGSPQVVLVSGKPQCVFQATEGTLNVFQVISGQLFIFQPLFVPVDPEGAISYFRKASCKVLWEDLGEPNLGPLQCFPSVFIFPDFLSVSPQCENLERVCGKRYRKKEGRGLRVEAARPPV